MYYLMPEFKCVIEYCPLRPDPNWRALDEALVALEEAKNAVAAYVAQNGHAAVEASVYGINLSTRNSEMLHRLKISDTGIGGTFYITAEIYKRVWEGGPPNAAELGAFSLSGSTNWDNSMTWDCIPVGAPGSSYPVMISAPYLPFNCRG
ncbi:MAG: pilin [Halioglobus sp.]